MKYLIFGQGFVAQRFLGFLGSEAMISPARLENTEDIKKTILEHQPDVVINCAGKTGRPNIDWCEDHKMETMTSNVTGPLTLLRLCDELNVYWVHVGSGCVYESKTTDEIFTEASEPNFFGSFYSRTKILSEKMLKEFPVLQLRLRMPLDATQDPRNFINKITHYQKVISVPNSISVMKDFLSAAKQLMEKRVTGIYNMTNTGFIYHHEILDMYKEIVDPNFHYETFSLEELHKLTKAKRSNCILSTEKLKKEGIQMREVHEAVRDTLIEYKKNLAEIKKT